MPCDLVGEIPRVVENRLQITGQLIEVLRHVIDVLIKLLVVQ